MLRKRQLLALGFAALAIAARVPFLVSGKIPFDSDEAVEGLMAIHVLHGELPAFLWGQAFKGIPEVYGAAAAFAVFGPGVGALKSVTLLLFAAYVGANFVLLDRIASRAIATGASVLLILCPPALVLWSLCASAEYVIVMLLGTAWLLLCRVETDAAPRGRRMFLVGLVLGLGLWVHQLFVIYAVPVLLIFAMRRRIWEHPSLRALNAGALLVAGLASVYGVLALIAFFTSGITLHIGTVTLTATAPQKMLRIAAGVAALAILLQLGSRSSRKQAGSAARRCWPGAVGFAIGYLPALLYSMFVEPARAPARVANLRDLLAAAPDIFGNIVPILAGFKIATTERLEIPWIAAIPVAAALGVYLWSERVRIARAFFPTFVVFVPLLFIAGGVYLDTLSYRYLIPWYAGLSVAAATGSLLIASHFRSRAGQRMAYMALIGAIACVHVWQQRLWYEKLTPDTASRATIDCLTRAGIRGGFADYWTSYKLTFLSNEALIVAPATGVDRYPAYTEFVHGLPSAARIDDAAACASRPQLPGPIPGVGNPTPR